MSKKIAVAIPCYNEEVTIAKVVKDFQRALPEADIYVFDNCSTDNSVDLAKEAGAVLKYIRRPGKGNVMRAILDEIEADVTVVVDGDDTYSAEDASTLIAPILNDEADMVVGDRLEHADKTALKEVNKFGNKMIVKIINMIFGTQYKDVLSGYRVFNRKFVNSIPLLTPGFETETEITLQALEEGLNVVELPIAYSSRPQDSYSKLKPFSDGWRILTTIAMLLGDRHPLRVYGLLSLISLSGAFVAGVLKFTNHLGVTAYSDSLLAGLILLLAPIGMILLGIGFLLSAINTSFKEMKQLMTRNK